jgi:hypothetical protein
MVLETGRAWWLVAVAALVVSCLFVLVLRGTSDAQPARVVSRRMQPDIESVLRTATRLPVMPVDGCLQVARVPPGTGPC